MTTRVQRLKKLLAVQEQMKALHETRHAGFLAEIAAAKADATEIVDRFNAEDSMSGLFPGIYHRRIAAAGLRETANRDMAATEAARIATATARTNMVERSFRQARDREERDRADRERLDLIAGKPAK